MEDEELEDLLDDCYAAKKRIEEDFLKHKEIFKEKGEYKGDFSEIQEELFDDLLYAIHIGYVNVDFLPNEKNIGNRFSTTDRHFKVSDDSIKEHEDLKRLIFSEQLIDVGDDEYCSYLVCQWCNFEDDYKGYILLPMKDGKYWCFYYQM